MSCPLKPQATAVITGAASGIGFATAKLCREKGMHLALIDIDREHLEKAKDILSVAQNKHVFPTLLRTEVYVLDVTDRSAWADVGRKIHDEFHGVDLLVLNAGSSFSAEQRFSKLSGSRLNSWMDMGYWDKTLTTNIFSPLHGISTFLPLLLSVPNPKSIVITGSKQGITNPPLAGNPAYNASKAAVRILAEHLSNDLRADPKSHHISVHLLIPGWTWTGLTATTTGDHGAVAVQEESEKKPRGAWYPSQVAQELERGLKEGRFYIVCPDGETDPALDQARIRWANDDIVENRSALSRWDVTWKNKAEEWIEGEAEKRRSGI